MRKIGLMLAAVSLAGCASVGGGGGVLPTTPAEATCAGADALLFGLVIANAIASPTDGGLAKRLAAIDAAQTLRDVLCTDPRDP